MSNQLAVRKARVSDLDNLTALEQRTFDYSRISRRNFRRLIQSSSVNFWVITEGQKLITYAITLARKNSRFWRIYSIAVDSQHRNRGLARAMLEHIITEAKKDQRQGLTLEVKVDNIVAIKLYQYYDFETVDLLPDYYDDGTDGFKMRLTFYPENH
ncbi:GNAT family N-acetyltransferase [Idiomarina seosinensis]|uniref:GNAT family N-acetyltransferase n=1 Tax=Idiomarina seosinensis TaxID=281739 RepID=UPI00384B3E75